MYYQQCAAVKYLCCWWRMGSQCKCQQERLESTMGKQLGRTWIEVNNGGNRFVGDGLHHPQILQNCPVEEILHADGWFLVHARYKKLSCKMHQKKKRCSNCTIIVIQVPASVFWLISIPGTIIHIFKNLWVYGKCHTVTSLIANVIGRLLTVQDANRFYHFDSGLLTCDRDKLICNWHFLILLYLFCF